MIDSVKRKHNTLTGITVNTTPARDPVSLAHRFASAISVLRTTYTLSDDFKQSLIRLEKQRTIADNIWYIDVDNALVAYENAVNAFNTVVSPEEQVVVYDLIKPYVKKLYVCQGPCYVVFETLPLAMYSHQAYCSKQHDSSGDGNYWWSCEYNVCPYVNGHWLECRASACSVLFPPPEYEYEYYDYDHKVGCTESVYSFWNPFAMCRKEYYTCEHSRCPDSNRHWPSGSSSPPNDGSGGNSGGNNNPTPTDNTPNCQDCTSDCSSPCSCSNSGTCGGTVVDNTPNCDQCTDGCSACPTVCSSCGSTYNPDSSSDVQQHKDVECIKCGTTYKLCDVNEWGDCSMSEPSPGWHHSAE